ncbi:alpha/beta fold hydrolase [Microbacterium sp. NPDC056057]|uniref:alpha/beta fold hydrolase n=1 Tax=Microbacterium sp. NPDC056057 TaxID=3345699 RepID=UPI0035DE2683
MTLLRLTTPRRRFGIMTEVVVGGLRIAYRRGGSGPPLVLFHGAFEDSRIWADELRTLSPHLDVIAWDAPGCGASGDVPRGWSDADWAKIASGFVTALGLTTPAVAGLSFGSVIALLLARHHPSSVGHLVLIGGYAGWGGSLDADTLAQRIAAVRFTTMHRVEEWAEDFLDSVYPPGGMPERRARARTLIDDWRSATTEALIDVMVQDLRPDLPEIRTPTVVVRGTADSRSPRAASLDLCAKLPRAHLLEIAGAGHDCSGPELDAVLLRAAREAQAAAATAPE